MRRVATCDSSALAPVLALECHSRPVYPMALSCLDFVDWLVQIDEGSREILGSLTLIDAIPRDFIRLLTS